MRAIVVLLLALPFLAACIADKGDAATPEGTTAAEVSGASEVGGTTDIVAAPLAELYRPVRFQPGNTVARLAPTRVPPPSLEAASAEPAIYPGGVERPGDPRAEEFADLPGTTDRVCVDTAETGARRLARSGDFVLDLATWNPPDHVFSLMPRAYGDRLLLRATRLDDSDAANPATLTHEYDHPSEDRGERRFDPVFVLPEAGEWLVVATAGPQWGCFLVTVADPDPLFGFADTPAEVEAAGASYSWQPHPAYLSTAFRQPRGPGIMHPTAEGWEMRGTEERVCFDVADGHDVRSGEWIVRPAAGLFESSPEWEHSKFLLIPIVQPATQDELQTWLGTPLTYVRLAGTLLDAPQHRYVYESRRPSGYRGNPDGQIEFEHLVQAVLPIRGDWMVVVTNGPTGTQWGCFMSSGVSSRHPS